jgi:flagellar hook-associated protein 2
LGISFGSIGTGLPKDIVQQIVNAEKIPVQQMEARKAKIENKQKLLGELTKLVEGMRGELLKNKGARSLRELSVINESDIIAVDTDKNVAMPGKYNLEVMQLAQKSSAFSNGVEDKEKSYLGVGYLKCYMPNGDTKEIYIDEDSSSLSGIAKLINADEELGMRANVINDGSGSDEPWRLVLALNNTGDGEQAEFPYIYLVDGEVDLYLEKERKAQDAKVKLDGFEVEVPSNTVTDLIPGVTINLKKARPGEEITFEIKEDVEAIAGKIETLVTNVNNVLKFIKDQNTLDEKSDTSQTLGGDSTLQSIESRIRSIVFSGVATDYGSKRIGDVGITFKREGLLQFDKEKFQAQMSENYKMVSQVLVGKYSANPDERAEGFIDRLEAATSALTSPPSGMLHTRKQGLKRSTDQIDQQIANKNRMIAQKEEVLKAKFARLEETMSRIKTQGAGLAGLAQAPNPVAQLG